MSRVIHFEIPAGDPERAANFYRKVFGWKIEKWPGPMEYWMASTGAEGTPGMMRSHGGQRTAHDQHGCGIRGAEDGSSPST